MTFPDDLDVEMARIASYGLPVDDWTADRLLAGRLDPSDAPPELAEAAQLISVATGPATADELAQEASVIAAMAAAITEESRNEERRMTQRHRVGGRIAKLVTAKAAVLGATALLGVTGAAAATGSLPAPAQSTVASALSYVGVEVPKPDAAPASSAAPATPPSHPKRSRASHTSHPKAPATIADKPDASTDDPTPTTVPAQAAGPNAAGPSRLGLCTAARVSDTGVVPDDRDPVAFKNLVAAADLAKVDIPTFCKDARAGQAVPTTATSAPAAVTRSTTTTTVDKNSTPTTSTTVGKTDESTTTTSTTTPGSTTTTTADPNAPTTTTTAPKPRGTVHRPTPDDTTATTAAPSTSSGDGGSEPAPPTS